MTTETFVLIAGFALILNHQSAILNLLLLNHHWHKCIIGTPLLFSNIIIFSYKSLHTISYLLSLSQQVPLKVVFALSHHSSLNIVNASGMSVVNTMIGDVFPMLSNHSALFCGH
jgi:hypothetical protein